MELLTPAEVASRIGTDEPTVQFALGEITRKEQTLKTITNHFHIGANGTIMTDHIGAIMLAGMINQLDPQRYYFTEMMKLQPTAQ